MEKIDQQMFVKTKCANKQTNKQRAGLREEEEIGKRERAQKQKMLDLKEERQKAKTEKKLLHSKEERQKAKTEKIKLKEIEKKMDRAPAKRGHKRPLSKVSLFTFRLR